VDKIVIKDLKKRKKAKLSYKQETTKNNQHKRHNYQ